MQDEHAQSIMSAGGRIVDEQQPFDFVSGLNEEQRIEFFGCKTKAALFDAGLLVCICPSNDQIWEV